MLKKIFLFYFLFWTFGTTLISSALNAGEYFYDGKQSQVSFSLKHLGIITVSGRFKTFSGSFQFDPGKIQDTTVNIHIGTASVDSRMKTRDKHLRSKKFFWSEKHPEIHFKSHAVKDIRGMKFKVYGNLTIRGITKPAIFETEFLSKENDARADRPIHFRAHTHIKRKDFKLGTGDWFDPISTVTDETLRINLEIKGLPKTS